MKGALSHKRVLQFVIGTGGVAILWQIASLFFPDYLFLDPPDRRPLRRYRDLVAHPGRFPPPLGAFSRDLSGRSCWVVLALVLNKSRSAEAYLTPVLTLLQGIPALSWVVIAIIWFRGIEFRIFFIMVMTTLPAFTFQVLDAYRAMSKDLFEMTLSFRPTRLDLFRTLIWPTVLPGILTAWKVNLGNASRVVVVAELVGATGGVGYELLQQQQIFDMAGAIAWTLVLVIFVLIVQGVITIIENHALRYRAVAERSF